MSRKRGKIQEEEELLEEAEAAPIPGPSKKRRAKGVRKPGIKTRLIRKLRQRQRELKSKLRTINKDINSLRCRRKKK